MSSVNEDASLIMPDLALDVEAKALHLLHTLAISSRDRLLKGARDSTRNDPVDLVSDSNEVLDTATFLCHLWWSGNGPEGVVGTTKASHTAQDLPPHYSMMLSVEVFAQYHHHVEAGSIDLSSTEVCLFCRCFCVETQSCPLKTCGIFRLRMNHQLALDIWK